MTICHLLFNITLSVYCAFMPKQLHWFKWSLEQKYTRIWERTQATLFCNNRHYTRTWKRKAGTDIPKQLYINRFMRLREVCRHDRICLCDLCVLIYSIRSTDVMLLLQLLDLSKYFSALFMNFASSHREVCREFK